MMQRMYFAVWMFAFAASTFCSPITLAQTYPTKPIRIVTGGAGGSTDLAARLIAQGLSLALGQQVVVDSRGAGTAGGAVPAEIVSKAAPDGYTLLLSSGVLCLAPFLRDNVPWDPVRDFLPITLALRSYDLVVVPPTLPVKSIRELIALAKARPGELNYGSSTAGSTSSLAPELFKAMAGVKIVSVPYRGTSPALGALIAGEVQLMILSASAVTQHIKSGRVRALAITSPKPSPQFPGMPTVSATGLPGFESGTITGMFAPVKTSEAIINRLNQTMLQFIGRADIKTRFLEAGSEPVGSSPAQLAAEMQSEMAKWGKVIKDAGIRAD